MLTITTGRLAVAVRSVSKSRSNRSTIKERQFSTEAPKGGASGSKFGGSDHKPRGSGAYTYKQAFEGHSSSNTSAGSEERRSNLSDRRASSAKRFSGVKKQDGRFSPLKGSESAGADGAGMPKEQQATRTNAGQVRQDRESMQGNRPYRGARGSTVRSASSEGKPMTASVTASSMRMGQTMDKDGDDAVYQGAAPRFERGVDGAGQGGYGGREGAGRGGQRARSDRSAAPGTFKPSATATGAAATARASGSAGARVAPLKKRKGEEDAELEDEEAASTESTQSRALGGLARFSAGGAEDGEAALGGEGGKVDAVESMRRVVDRDLAGDLDELGEERLVGDVKVAAVDEAAEREAHAIREKFLASQSAREDTTLELGLVTALDDFEEGPDFNAELDRLLRRTINSTSRTFTMDDLLAADDMNEIVGEEHLTTASEMLEEQEIMDTPMVFGQSSDVSLHSEKGLIYGVVDIFDRLVSEKQRQMLVKAKKQRRFELWKAVSWSVRQKKFAGKRKRKQERRKAALALRTQNESNSDMAYYPELDLFISRTELRNDLLRNAVSGAVANPTWSREQRRKFILGVQKDIVAMNTPMSAEKEKIREQLWTFPKKVKSDDSRTIEHLLTLPVTDWGLLMAQAERSMDARQRSGRFEPSPYEQRKNKL